MNAPPWVVVPVIVLVATAAGADVRTRKIPNMITFPAMLLGVALHAALAGTAGFTSSLEGLAFAGGALMPGYLMRWMGAGDVKLMAAVGAWLGWPLGAIAVLASLVMGGVISLIVAVRRGILRQALTSAALMAGSVLTPGGAGSPVTSGVRFPFALAVLAGSTFACWIRP
jgi:prepilin peptidase CpaA